MGKRKDRKRRDREQARIRGHELGVVELAAQTPEPGWEACDVVVTVAELQDLHPENLRALLTIRALETAGERVTIPLLERVLGWNYGHVAGVLDELQGCGYLPRTIPSGDEDERVERYLRDAARHYVIAHGDEKAGVAADQFEALARLAFMDVLTSDTAP